MEDELQKLKSGAERCRRLARGQSPATEKMLLEMAAEYEARAAALERVLIPNQQRS